MFFTVLKIYIQDLSSRIYDYLFLAFSIFNSLLINKSRNDSIDCVYYAYYDSIVVLMVAIATNMNNILCHHAPYYNFTY